MTLLSAIASCSASMSRLQLGIDRDQPVLAADLHAVAGKEHHRDLGPARALAELEQCTPHVVEGGISDAAHRKAQALERRRDVAGVVGRIGQHRHVAIGAVADHQGDAGLGVGRLRTQHRARDRGDEGEPMAPIEAQAHGPPRRNAVRGQGYSVEDRLQLAAKGINRACARRAARYPGDRRSLRPIFDAKRPVRRRCRRPPDGFRTAAASPARAKAR